MGPNERLILQNINEAEMVTKATWFYLVILVKRNEPMSHVLLPFTCFKCSFLQIGIKATHVKLPRTATESEVSCDGLIVKRTAKVCSSLAFGLVEF